MIRKVHIQGFKSVLDAEIELGQINVFVGPNGVGKTNLLEAVGFLSAAVSGFVDAASVGRRGVRWGSPSHYKPFLQGVQFSNPIVLEVSAGNGSREVVYRAELDNPMKKPLPSWQYITESLWVADNLVMERRGNQLRIGQDWEAGNPRPEQGYARLAYYLLPDEGANDLESLQDFAIFAPQTPVLRGIANDPMPVSPLGLSGGGFAEFIKSLLESPQGEGKKVVHYLREMVDWVENIEVVHPTKALIPPALPTTRYVIVFTDKRGVSRRNQVTAYDASEGVLYALFALALALHPALPLFLAVDNFGCEMHPWLVRKLMNVFCDLLLRESPHRQVILTTHCPVALDGLPLQDPRVRLFAIESDLIGATTVRPIVATEEARALREEHGLVLSDLWVQGWLGAVPESF